MPNIKQRKEREFYGNEKRVAEIDRQMREHFAFFPAEGYWRFSEYLSSFLTQTISPFSALTVQLKEIIYLMGSPKDYGHFFRRGAEGGEVNEWTQKVNETIQIKKLYPNTFCASFVKYLVHGKIAIKISYGLYEYQL